MRASSAFSIAVPACAAALMLSVAGCRAPAIEEENARLRARSLDLEQRNKQLAQRNAELEAELERQAADPDATPAEIRAAMPHAVEIRIGRLSHARDQDDDGLPEEILVYLRPLDGRGRFVQMTGDVHVSAAVVPADAAPIELGRVRLSPVELRDAYRSGLAGTHYTVSVPLSLPGGVDRPWIERSQAVVSVTFTEAETGRRLSEERVIPLHR